MYSPLISIIIPFYNRVNTLAYCVDSVLNQEYLNWELIIVDDGSTDDSSMVCQSYKNKDKRIRYVYQNNQGAGPARNRGIEEANGEWITFVDSDDAIMPNHLSQLLANGEKCDMVMTNRCQAKYENGTLKMVSDYATKEKKDIFIKGNKEIIEFLYGEFEPYKHANYACWDKFFRMSIINKHNIRYPLDVPTGQDQVFVVKYFRFTDNFYFSNVGTYAPTPLGNEGIDHLACELRSPKEFLYCQKKNYEALLELAESSQVESVRQYAVNYILDKPFTRIIVPYTTWKNRKRLGKQSLLSFIKKDFLPIVRLHKDELHLVKNTTYQHQLINILEGKEEKVYNYWYYLNLKKDIKSALLRRMHKLASLFVK